MNQNGVLHIETSKGYEDSAVSKYWIWSKMRT